VNHEATLTFEYDSPERARRVERAIGPELGDIEDDRSRVAAHRTGDSLELAVEARDLVALRAALNTWLSLVTVAEEAGDAC
jgi:KEOPS complex subunit Pcc1